QYLFSTGTGTYTSLTSGTSVSAIQADDAYTGGVNIGFTFNYCGTNYTTASVSSNGWFTFGSPTGSTLTNTTGNIASTGNTSLFPVWDDLDGAVGTASYITTGTAPNRVFTFEWKNWQWNYGASGSTISFQVKLFETTNVIQFIYQQESGAINSPSATIGMATSQTDYLVLDNSSTAPAASSSAFTLNIASKPATGQIYIFSPPLPCSGTPVAGTANASV